MLEKAPLTTQALLKTNAVRLLGRLLKADSEDMLIPVIGTLQEFASEVRADRKEPPGFASSLFCLSVSLSLNLSLSLSLSFPFSATVPTADPVGGHGGALDKGTQYGQQGASDALCCRYFQGAFQQIRPISLLDLQTMETVLPLKY